MGINDGKREVSSSTRLCHMLTTGYQLHSVAGVERGQRKGGIRETGFSLFLSELFFPFSPALFMRLPRRLSTAVNASTNVTPFAI